MAELGGHWISRPEGVRWSLAVAPGKLRWSRLAWCLLSTRDGERHRLSIAIPGHDVTDGIVLRFFFFLFLSPAEISKAE